MHLTVDELEKLQLHNAGFLAQKRLARGLRLNYPETVALIATQIMEFVRDGRTINEVLEFARQMLGYNDVMDGVPAMLEELRVEGTFPDGLHAVIVRNPVIEEYGNLALALYGSFLPIPSREALEGAHFGVAPCTLEGGIGEIIPSHGEVLLNAGRSTIDLCVKNTGVIPVYVSSHFHFMEAGKTLQFERSKAYGMRLNIPAGLILSFEPGETKTVHLVEIAGNQVLSGSNGIAKGGLYDANREKALSTLVAMGYANI